MNEAVLFVDDEPRLLAVYRLFLQPMCAVQTASGGEEALAVMASHGPFAVVVTDLNMPQMNGIQFLKLAREKYPDTVRLLLTGNPDLDSAVQAVNDGHLFRFLTKPCGRAALTKAVRAGVEQYRLITAQKDLLENTLRASIRVLGEVLAAVSPAAFGKSLRVRQLVRDLSAAAGVPEDWAVDAAATLCQLGCVSIPDAVLGKADRGEELDEADRHALARHPLVGYELLRTIPRLERVAELVAHQNNRHVVAGTLTGANVPPGAGLLKVALDFDTLRQQGGSETQSLERMHSQDGWYDPVALDALAVLVRRHVPLTAREIPVEHLAVGMSIASDVRTVAGVLLVKAGVEVTEAIKIRLQTIAAQGIVASLINVFVPKR